MDEGVIPDAVGVGLAAGVVLRVEIGAGRRRFQNTDLVRQRGVERELPFVVGEPTARHIGVGHLPERMHARVGAARADDDDALADELRKRRLHEILHGVLGRLTLPAAERTAVVGDEQSQPQVRFHSVIHQSVAESADGP